MNIATTPGTPARARTSSTNSFAANPRASSISLPMKRPMTFLVPLLAVTCLAAAGPTTSASAATSVSDEDQLAFPPQGDSECKSHGDPIRLRGWYAWRSFSARSREGGRTANLRTLRFRGQYHLTVCRIPRRRSYEIKATVTNVRTGGEAINQTFLFGGGPGDIDDFTWGTELEHTRR
jgi:hypothetical protein